MLVSDEINMSFLSIFVQLDALQRCHGVVLVRMTMAINQEIFFQNIVPANIFETLAHFNTEICNRIIHNFWIFFTPIDKRMTEHKKFSTQLLLNLLFLINLIIIKD